MSVLVTAQKALATYLQANTSIDPVRALVPVPPRAQSAYVWPSDQWISTDDSGGSYCRTRSVGLSLDIVAGTVDLEHAQTWLADSVDEVWAATADGFEVVAGQRIVPVSADQPNVIQADGGVLLLAVRVKFSRFDMED